MRKTEEFKVLGIMTLTLVLLIVFCLSTSDVLALLVLGFIGVMLALAYYRFIKKERLGPTDERSERISFIASRNGFLAMVVLLALDAIIVQRYGTLSDTVNFAIVAWGLGVFAYITTYVYGMRGA
jgi:uncharacterized membrane protein